jgi:hypothetical protein
MKDQLENRLLELRAEFDSGQQVLSELEAKQTQTKSTLLRISGAIQVLQELLNQDQVDEQVEQTVDSSDENASRLKAIG